MADVTTHSSVIRPDRMALLTESDRIPERLRRLEKFITGGFDWHEIGAAGEPTFSNGWVNFGGIYATAGFCKDPFEFVHLKGLVKSGTINSIAFQLPVGYRPTKYAHYATLSNDALGGIRIDTNGTVQLGPPGTNAWVSLDGVTFRTV